MSEVDFFSSALERYLGSLQAQGYAEATLRCYGNDLKRFGKWIQKNKDCNSLSDIGRDDLMDFCQALTLYTSRYGKPLAATSRNHHLNALRSFFGYQVKRGFLLSSPATVLTNFKTQRKLPRVPSYEQILKLFAAVDDTSLRGLRDRAWLEILYGSGLRLGEVHKLDVTDICFEEELLHVRLGKGDKDRYVPMTPECKKSLLTYLKLARPRLANGTESGLFVSIHGKRMAKSSVSPWLHKYTEQAGLTVRITPHVLRHACATHLLKNGASIRHIQELLGHENLSTTQIYTKVEVADLRNVLRRCHPRENFDGG